MNRKQSGIATVVVLIALVIMLIAAVALIHSTGVSQVAAGNLAFRRDVTNRGEAAIAQVDTYFAPGGALNSESAKQNNLASNNYSATILPSTTNSAGIPDALLESDSSFTGTWKAGDITDSAGGVTIRFIIERMCNAAGAATTANCSVGQLQRDTSGTAGEFKAGGGMIPVYRVSVRVSGPHNTQAFLQGTFTQ